jgi:predicted aspartyl protease
MIRSLSVGVCASLAIGAAAAASDCSLKQIASLEMLNRGEGEVVVSGEIAGVSHPFLVDAGGAQSVIYRDVAEKLGLTTLPIPSDFEIYDLEGKLAKRYVRAQFSLGSVRGDKRVMVVANREPSETLFDGVLGSDILRNFDLEFDFAARKLNLMSSQHCEGRVVYWASAYADAEFTIIDQHIVLPMTLDGRQVQATLDTGSSVTGISESLARRLFKIERSSSGVEVDPEADANSLWRYRYRFKSLSIGGLSVNNPLLYLIPDTVRQSFDKRHTDKLDFDPTRQSRLNTAELLLGMNVLSKLHLYVAYKERKIYLTAANAH